MKWWWIVFIVIVSCKKSDLMDDDSLEWMISPTTITSEETPFSTSVESTMSPMPTGNEISPTPFSWDECPPEWFLIESTRAEVGAPPEVYDQVDEDGYHISRVRLYEAEVDEFCISPLPFPGKIESEWPDGMNLAQVEDFDVALAEFGIRLATGSEYLIAVATSANHRWPQDVGSWAEAGCDGDPYNPSLMGTHPTCVSSLGVGSLLTFAFWVKTDPNLEEALSWSNVEEYVVMGGMPPQYEAFYGDDHWGAHPHGDEEPYFDDKPGFLVSTPWEVTPQQWEDFQEFRVTRTKTRYSLNHRRPVVL